MSSLAIHSPDNKLMGEIVGETAIIIKRPEHFFIKYQAFGLSEQLIKHFQYKGIKKILFEYRNGISIKRYYATLEQFISSVKTWTFRDNDLQYFVSVGDMRV